ncbi:MULTISPECIES: anti sigma factor C-terminal domain-containing protein [unclassified Lactococcus]|uniref:anti sigma factor C-terminal domain-containing protein n=1 Tax=unclassified Lactococcus TaxID=2643510 RepID=UPI0011CBCBC4|nr:MULTISPECIES: anti sigma factor C-terminal domain-containing protein [unclassified Lactococcus]MQW24071.1 hypothetical protein [Lactococcus sp. dk101]TXK36470.1 hypothetical protein FVP42_11260 [Lactococcus sp. dk310]TXK47178.1 hypothetical protein FVP43_10495 [Lactococcus sp. dk322]
MKNLDKEFMKLAKRNKLKRRLITIGISILTTLVILSGLGIWRSSYLQEQNKKVSEMVNIYSEISAPNTVSTITGTSQGLLSGSYTLSSYKNLDGIPVPLGTRDINYGFSFSNKMWWLAVGNEDYVPGGTIENISYREGQKRPQFYQISLADAKIIGTKESFPQEIKKLEQVSDYVSEVAITFDKPYTYREILKMVPDNLLLNWLSLSRSVDATYYESYPIDIGISTTINTYSKDGIYYDDENGSSVKLNQREVLSLPGDAGSNGIVNDGMYSDFVAAVKRSIDYDANDETRIELSNGDDFYPYRDAVKQVKKYPKLDDATFSGIILSGRNENFKQLQNKSWIAASSIGATTRYFSYLPTTK